MAKRGIIAYKNRSSGIVKRIEVENRFKVGVNS